LLSYFMGCIVLVRCVLVFRCGLAGMVCYPDAGFTLHPDTTPSSWSLFIQLFCVHLNTTPRRRIQWTGIVPCSLNLGISGGIQLQIPLYTHRKCQRCLMDSKKLGGLKNWFRNGDEKKVSFPGNEMQSLSPWILLQ
jgi:hypothetical protein